MDRPPPILQYTQLGVPPPPKTPPKKKMQIVGWCLVCAPFILYSMIGVSISLSNLLAPGRGYRMGRSTVTPISHGAANDVVKLVFAIAVGAFSIFVLYRAIRKVGREK
jgi:amino acid transporter